MSTPILSIIVIFHKMTREAKRTLHALSTAYQTGVSADRYEVIAVENGVQELDPDWVQRFGPNFRYHFHATQSVSPVGAVNAGAGLARGTHLAIVVDGARIPTPGLVGATLQAIRGMGTPCFVGALAWHLGPDAQWKAMLDGYDQSREDALLDSINWPEDGYRMFGISTIAPASKCGFLNGLPRECSWLALPVRRFQRLGGYDEGFQTSGGGLVNHDFLRRLCALKNLTPVMLLGEGTFHQVHGGAMTGQTVADRERIYQGFCDEYQALRQREFIHETLPDCAYLGTLHKLAEPFVRLTVT